MGQLSYSHCYLCEIVLRCSRAAVRYHGREEGGLNGGKRGGKEEGREGRQKGGREGGREGKRVKKKRDGGKGLTQQCRCKAPKYHHVETNMPPFYMTERREKERER